MEEKIKGIVSVFLQLPAGQIDAATPIDRAALKSSILMHRMYAKLADEGITVDNYADIKVVGDLLRRQTSAAPATNGAASSAMAMSFAASATGMTTARVSGGDPAPGVGIDIEEVAALPRALDFRKEAFYTENFTPAEIAYCILQADPYASFAGLFAAKEAIVKAEGRYHGQPFNRLEISHSAEGRPLCPGFGLSISHAGAMAVAVAVRAGGSPLPSGWAPGPVFAGTSADNAAPDNGAPAGKPASTAWVSWIALLLAVAALSVALKH